MHTSLLEEELTRGSCIVEMFENVTSIRNSKKDRAQNSVRVGSEYNAQKWKTGYNYIVLSVLSDLTNA